MHTNTEVDGEKVKMSDGGISLNRWKALMNDERPQLTPEEIAEGWHFCNNWDGLLVGPNTEEWKYCSCVSKPNEKDTTI